MSKESMPMPAVSGTLSHAEIDDANVVLLDPDGFGQAYFASTALQLAEGLYGGPLGETVCEVPLNVNGQPQRSIVLGTAEPFNQRFALLGLDVIEPSESGHTTFRFAFVGMTDEGARPVQAVVQMAHSYHRVDPSPDHRFTIRATALFLEYVAAAMEDDAEAAIAAAEA